MKKAIKKIILTIIKKVVVLFKPLIRYAAECADIKLNYAWVGTGQHAVIFEDTKEIYQQCIPKSTTFNTRSGKIVVGANCIFGEEVMLLTGKHNFISDVTDEKDLHMVPEDGREIIIGKNCYIGSGAIVIGKVTIGDYAVIGAGSVVTKDVPSRTLYAGVPAVKIKDLKRNDY